MKERSHPDIKNVGLSLYLRPSQSRGFTIVELLIVVVVIAILAAITIVAYNGITNRAKASTAQSAAKQAFTKLQAYAVDNADQFPADVASAGIKTNERTSYQYRVNNNATPKTFCLTATINGVSSYLSSASPNPAIGACPGHGANGAETITNLASDPRATSLTAINGGLSWRNSRWFGSSPAAGTHSIVTNANDGPVGITSYVRKTWTVAPAAISNSSDTGFELGTGRSFLVTAGETLTLSCYLRPSVNRNFRFSIESTNTDGVNLARINATSVAGPANVWTRLSYTWTVPAGTARITPLCDSTSGTANGAVNWSVGNTLDGTGIMVTSGSTLYPYGDGESAGWIWNGTPNASNSSGPVAQ